MHLTNKEKAALRRIYNRGLTIRKIPYNEKPRDKALDYMHNYKPYQTEKGK